MRVKVVLACTECKQRNYNKKIVWPTPKATFKNTGGVLVTILVGALFVFLLDTVFMNLLGLVMNVAG